jgi:hypothetical protein
MVEFVDVRFRFIVDLLELFDGFDGSIGGPIILEVFFLDKLHFCPEFK